MWQSGKPASPTTGVINSASNVGTGAEVYKTTLASDLKFRTLLAGTGITITELTDEVQITASGTTNSWIIDGNTITGTTTGLIGSLNLVPISVITNGINRIGVSAFGAIRFHNAYTFPDADGTDGQVLSTDGAGNLIFSSSAFTSQASTTPHAANTWIRIGEMTDNGYVKLAINSEDGAGVKGLQIISNTTPTAGGGIVDINLTEAAGTPRVAAYRVVYNTVSLKNFIEVLIDSTGSLTNLDITLLAERTRSSFKFVVPFAVAPSTPENVVVYTSNFGVNAIMALDSSAHAGHDFFLDTNNKMSLWKYTFPLADGTAKQAITTDGLGQLSFTTLNGVRNLVSARLWTAGTWVRIGSLVADEVAELDIKLQNTGLGSGSIRLSVGSYNGFSGGTRLDVAVAGSLQMVQAVRYVRDSLGTPMFVEIQIANGNTFVASTVVTGESTIGAFQLQDPLIASPGTGLVLNTVLLTTGTTALMSQQDMGVYFRALTNTNTVTIGNNASSLVRINNLYSLPQTDGTVGQFMTTDGAGSTSWTDGILGGINTGTGVGIYNGVNVNSQMQFKSLVAGSKITLTPTADSITIASSDISGSAWGTPNETTASAVASIAPTSGFLTGVTKAEFILDYVADTSGADVSIKLAFAGLVDTNFVSQSVVGQAAVAGAGTTASPRIAIAKRQGKGAVKVTVSFAPTGQLLITSNSTSYSATSSTSSTEVFGVTQISGTPITDLSSITFTIVGANFNQAKLTSIPFQPTGAGGGPLAYIQGGNNFGTNGTLGLTTANNLNIITNNATRIGIAATGAVTFNGLYTFPTVAGLIGQTLVNDGAGNLSWASAGASQGWQLSGNALLATGILGTTTTFGVDFITDNIKRMSIDDAGYITFGDRTGTDYYTFPLLDGTAGYALVTDGAGTLSWSNATGEIITGSNLGSGAPVFFGKVGTDMQFRTLGAGSGISILYTPTDITISATGGNSWLLGGNTVIAPQTLGTISPFGMSVITNNITRMFIGINDDITFHNAYTFPLTGGTNNQIMKLSPSGQMNWGNNVGSLASSRLNLFQIAGLSGSDAYSIDSLPLVNTITTGLISGGAVTQASSTTVNIDALSANFTDNTTSPGAPTFVRTNLGPWVGVTLTGIATNDFTILSVDSAGNLFQTYDITDFSLWRGKVYLGIVGHIDRTSITSVQNQTLSATNVKADVADLSAALGTIKVSGNVIAPNGANLSINKSLGKVFKIGFNYKTNFANPNLIDNAALTLATFTTVYRSATPGLFVYAPGNTVLNVAQYDNGTGTLASVGNNNFSIKRVYLSASSNTLLVTYGQAVYATIDDAVNALNTENPVLPNGVNTLLMLCQIIVKGNATNLTVPAQAKFFQSTKLGESYGGGGATSGGGTQTFQSVYDLSTTKPQILTSTGIGSLQIKRGSAADTDRVLEVLTGAGVASAWLTGGGDISSRTKFVLQSISVNELANLSINGTAIELNALVTQSLYLHSVGSNIILQTDSVAGDITINTNLQSAGRITSGQVWQIGGSAVTDTNTRMVIGEKGNGGLNLNITNTASTLDNKHWVMGTSNSGIFSLKAYNDSFSQVGDVLSITRNGTTALTFGIVVGPTIGAGLTTYTLPSARGTDGQTLISDATGGVSWGSISAVDGLPKWIFSTATTDSDPGAGKFKYNNAAPSLVTFIYINYSDKDTADLSTVLKGLGTGSVLYYKVSGSTTKFTAYKTSGAVVDATTYLKIPVTFLDQGTFAVLDTDVAEFNIYAVASGGGTGLSDDGIPKWNWSVGTTDTDPGSGKYAINNVTVSSATQLYISKTTVNGAAFSSGLAQTFNGSALYFVIKNTPSKFQRFTATGVPTDGGTYWKIPISFVNQGATPFVAGDEAAVTFLGLIPPAVSNAAGAAKLEPYSVAMGNQTKVLNNDRYVTAVSTGAGDLTVTQIEAWGRQSTVGTTTFEFGIYEWKVNPQSVNLINKGSVVANISPTQNEEGRIICTIPSTKLLANTMYFVAMTGNSGNVTLRTRQDGANEPSLNFFNGAAGTTLPPSIGARTPTGDVLYFKLS